MNDTAQFISDLNVARFVDRLRVEHDPAVRALLQRLLLKELENSGFSCDQLGNVLRWIADGRRQIEKQKALIKSMTVIGQDVRRAKTTLINLAEIQTIFEQYRQAVVDAKDQNSTKRPPGANAESLGSGRTQLTPTKNDRREIAAITQVSQPRRRLWSVVRSSRRSAY
jgi:hypothetical protein